MGVVSIPSQPCTKQPCCLDGTPSDTNWTSCRPGFEYCHPLEEGWEKIGPQYHLRDRTGCGENDPNGIVFDPVHGVVHHFFSRNFSKQQKIFQGALARARASARARAKLMHAERRNCHIS